MQAIYLDHASSTPVRGEVREAMLPFLSERFGNPSSAHGWGQESRVQLEEARARLARLIGASPGEIVFTSGGTEADNLAILGRARLFPGSPVVCSAL
ncbi:MAG: aminotransferase class V-fold PLP-dependent enzyme, partial [Gemmatimonadetes bacterium]|nr:aminotransferase class V-fold PLP-dependent enzyme [Gemmatimonadota bacterium]